MAKLIWLIAVMTVVAVSANDIQGVLPLPEGADVRIETQHDEPEKIVEPPMPALKLTKSEPMKLMENSKDLKPETVLQPLGPFFPSYFQPDNMFGFPNNRGQEDETEQGKGILTIILVKNHQNPESGFIQDSEPSQISNLKDEAVNFKNNMVDTAQEKFQSLTQLIFNDLFGKNLDQAAQADSKMSVGPHLLGGRDDPDHFILFGNNGESDFIRTVKGEEMPIMSDDIGRYPEYYGHHAENKKCNFMRYLRLKAHIHYRTIVHLVFISGVILMMLMMISLTIKVHKRRNALRRYAQQNIDVSSIDSAYAKHKEAEGEARKNDRRFRLGTLTSSYEQKMASNGFLTAPPAYEQVNGEGEQKTKQSSSLVKSLAAAYKSRYQRMPSNTDDDSKSVSSLPAYEEKPESKE